jgi:hypothetical protein
MFMRLTFNERYLGWWPTAKQLVHKRPSFFGPFPNVGKMVPDDGLVFLQLTEVVVGA